MKKLNKKGFTLIELLAVITIMGILMVVAIPAISRTIENTRRDSFLDTAKQYTNSVKTLWISDGIECNGVSSSAVTPGKIYYLEFDSEDTGSKDDDGDGAPDKVYITDLLDSGGKSSWGNKNVHGYVFAHVTGDGSSRKVKYSVSMREYGSNNYDDHIIGTAGNKKENGIAYNTEDFLSLKRSDVKVAGISHHTVNEYIGILPSGFGSSTNYVRCKIA